MQPTFRIVAGSRAGFVFVPVADAFTAGRHPDAGLRFSAEHDRTVSTLHAEFSRSHGVWHVRDLDSRNGTWVNGQRVTGSVALQPGDRIVFGSGGPEVRFEVRHDVAAGAVAGPESNTQKLRAAIQREKTRLRLVAAGVLTVVILFAAMLVVSDSQERAEWDADRHTYQARIDSLLAVGRTADASLETEVSGLRAALRESEEHLRRLRAELGAATRSSGSTADLERELLVASMALERQQHAAALDFQLIQRRNRRAVAMIWVEYRDGSLATGTAFAVRPDGTMLTNRHVIHGHTGDLVPRRIAIRFADSDQAFPATLLAISDNWDMAAVRVENILGDVPTVARISTRPDTLPAGAAVALIGFPLGGDPDATPGSANVARPIVSAGLVETATSRTLELQGLGAAGGSGSPILDAAGDVVGMLYGGRSEGGSRILIAVPALALINFLYGIR